MDLGSAIELEAITQALLMHSDDFARVLRRVEARVANPTGKGADASGDHQRARAARAAGLQPRRPGRRHGLPRRSDRRGATLAEQFDDAAANAAHRAARRGRRRREDLVSLQIFVTDVDEYRASQRELGEVWRKHFGRHYPAMGLFGVTGLAVPEAMVELMGIAVLSS